MRLSLAKRATENDFNNVNSFDSRVKVNVLQLYLIGDEKYTYNTIEVEKKIFGNGDGRQVSAILRCYNIGDKNHRSNSGIYRNNRIKGFKVTKEDIANFVECYPYGCFPKTDFETWFNNKIKAKLAYQEDLKMQQEYEKKLKEIEVKKQQEMEQERLRQLEKKYVVANGLIEKEPKKAIDIFKQIIGYKDSKEKNIIASYNYALYLYKDSPCEAIEYFRYACDYKNSNELLKESLYLVGNAKLSNEPFEAIKYLKEIADYKDTNLLIKKCESEMQKQQELYIKIEHKLFVRRFFIIILIVFSIIVTYLLYVNSIK